MADLWGTLAGIGASLWESSQEDDRAAQAASTAKELSPNVTQQASMWQNQQNMGNQTWAQKQNQAAMDKAGVGTNTDAFGTTSRTQNPDGSWKLNTTLNSGDQQLLDALRGKSTAGVGNLDMTGNYNVNGAYAKNFDALNRPALERSQQAQRDAAAAMGMGWGSGKGNDVLQSQLNDESTRFGLSVQNAGHDAWNADQATLKNNLGFADSMMGNIKSRQTAAPEWGKYATVNAPTSTVVNKGDINSNLGWAASVGGGNADGTMPGYTNWKAPTSASGAWSGGALSATNASGGSTSWNGGGWTNGEPVQNDYAFMNALNDLNGLYGGNNWWSSVLPGKAGLSAITELTNKYNNYTPGQGGAGYYSSSIPAGMGYQTNYSQGPGSGAGGWGAGNGWSSGSGYSGSGNYSGGWGGGGRYSGSDDSDGSSGSNW